MKTEIKTPVTDSCTGSADRFGDRDVIPATIARKIETVSLNQAEGHLVKHLLELYNASWEAGNCRRDCCCAKCEALQEAGNHNSSTFDSLTEKASAAMSNIKAEPPPVSGGEAQGKLSNEN
jgi:hypothetical protein